MSASMQCEWHLPTTACVKITHSMILSMILSSPGFLPIPQTRGITPITFHTLVRRKLDSASDRYQQYEAIELDAQYLAAPHL